MLMKRLPIIDMNAINLTFIKFYDTLMWKKYEDMVVMIKRRPSLISKKGIALFLCVLLLTSALSGCLSATGGSTPAVAAPAEGNGQLRRVIEEADPDGAIQAIYDSIEEYDARKLTSEEIKEQTGILPIYYNDAIMYYSNHNSGLADIAIFKPVRSFRDSIRKELYLYKEKRMEQFQNYNILDAYPIAQNTVIYDQGDYVIMLMTTDNDLAKTIIDIYIPQ